MEHKRFDYAPPKNEADFEEICLELLRCRWRCPQLQRYGHRGESQHGVDIFDPTGSLPVRAAQSKMHGVGKTIPPVEIRQEVAKAKTFQPPLSLYCIVTTAKKSTKSQQCVREINEQHRTEGLFEVELLTWDEVAALLDEHPDVRDRWYNTFSGNIARAIQQQLHEIVAKLPEPDSRPTAAKNLDESHAEAADCVNSVANSRVSRLGDAYGRKTGACLVYLERVADVLGQQALLKRFGRSLDGGGLRVPLRVEAYDAARLRDRHMQMERERDNLRMRPADPEIEKRIYAYRGAWEENEDKDTSQPEPLEPLFEKLEMAMLLGDPGSGKSEALKGFAARTARGLAARLKAFEVPPEELCLPVFAELPAVAHLFHEEGLASELRAFGRNWLGLDGAVGREIPGPGTADWLRLAVLKTAVDRLVLDNATGLVGCGPAARKIWEEWSGLHPSGLLLLDAWDEVASRYQSAEFKSALGGLGHCSRMRVLVTSRVTGFEPGLLDIPASAGPNSVRRELVILPFRDVEVEQFVRAFFPESPGAESLLGELRAKPMVGAMLQNPLLATLVCLAFDPTAPEPVPLPAKRAAVYTAVTRRLLDRTGLGTEARIELEDAFRALAYQIFPDEVFTVRNLQEFCASNKPDPGGSLARYLIETKPKCTLFDCMTGCGLLARQGEYGLRFLHLTFEEYFAGGYLAAAACAKGWKKAKVKAQERDQPVPLLLLLDKRGWDPRWREVVALTAGQINPKQAPVEPLLETLLACHDDIFGHRFCLAVLCLAEAPAFDDSPAAAAAKIGRIGWEWSSKSGAKEGLADKRIVRYFALVNPPIGTTGRRLDANLTEAFQVLDKNVIAKIKGPMKTFGPTLATQGALAALARILADRQALREWGSLVFDVVGEAGPVAASSEILAALTSVLEDSSVTCLRKHDSIATLKQFGAAAAVPAVVNALAGIVRHPTAGIDVERATKELTEEWGQDFYSDVYGITKIRGSDLVVKTLPELPAKTKEAALEVLKEIGSLCPTRELFAALNEVIGNSANTDNTRSKAIQTTGHLAKVVQTSAIPATIASILEHRDANYYLTRRSRNQKESDVAMWSVKFDWIED